MRQLGYFEIEKLLNDCFDGNLSAVKQLGYVDFNVQDMFCRTPISQASIKGHTELVKYLYEKGADVNQVTVTSPGALVQASIGGHLELVKFLYPLSSNEIRQNALGQAAECNHQNIACYLLKMGVDINARIPRLLDSSTPLCLAAQCGHIDMMHFLIQQGATFPKNPKNKTDSKNETFFKRIFRKGKGTNFFGFSSKGEDMFNPLCDALLFEKEDAARFLIEQGCRLDSNTPALSPLAHAISGKNLNCVKLIVEAGADLFVNNSPKTILEMAQNSQNKEIIDYIQHAQENVEKVQPQRYNRIKKQVLADVQKIKPEEHQNLPKINPNLYGTLVAYSLWAEWFEQMKYQSQVEVYKVHRHEMKKNVRLKVEEVMRQTRGRGGW